MYNQGNNQQFGQRLPTVLPPPPFQLGRPRPAPPPYALASSASMLLGPPASVPPSGMLNSSQSYSNSRPPPQPHSYSTAPQNSNWNQNQHISQPPHPQGQQFYGVPRAPLLPGGIQGLQQAPPMLPPPPTSSYFTPAPFGSFVQPVHESSLGHLPPPPPSSPPPGPPPLPPSSPPPNSPFRKSSVVDMVPSGVIDKSIDDGYRNNDTLNHDKSLKHTTVNDTDISVRDTSGVNSMSDIPSPPPRPRDEKTVKKIEVLCRYIAKNGHEFEKMTCQKEAGNPEYNFLFGGFPGSEAAISHEYFKWMKNKCSSSELCEGRHDSDMSLEPSGVGSLMQPYGKLHSGISHSPAGSDMDMEDDITQPEEPGSGLFGGAKLDHTIIFNDVDIRVEGHACDSEHILDKDATNGNLFCSVSTRVIQQGTNISQNDMQFEKSSMKDDVTDSELFLDNRVEQPNVTLPHEVIQSGASAAAKVCSSEVPDELIRGTSSFSLIQGYASDDSSENDDDPHLVNVSPATVSPQVKEGITHLHPLQTDIEPKSSGELNKGFRTERFEKVKDSFLVKEQVEEDYGRHGHGSIDGDTSILSSKQNDRLEGDDTVGPKSLGDQKEGGNANLEVDEFGRLVKAGKNDSDSDDYSRRRGKRGRSRSRSRSPNGRRRRRRSPWRRREKRSRSRSWSPKRRSRSRSPYRHGGGTGGDWSRRNRSHLPVCYDFRIGKCFRGASCRYVHESEKGEEARRHKKKQQYQERSERVRSFDKFVPEKDEVDKQEMQVHQDVDKSSDRAPEELVEPSVPSSEVARTHDTLDANKLGCDVSPPPVTDVDDKKLLAIEKTESLATGSAMPGQVLTGEHSLNQMSPAEAQLPVPSLPQGTHASSHLAREYNIMPTSNYPLYQASLSSDHSHSSVPPASSWNPLPPPPPRPQLGGLLPPYQQNQLPIQVNYPFQAFARPYGPTTHAQAGESHIGVYPPAMEFQQPLTQIEDFRPRTFPVNYPAPHQPSGPRVFAEENFTRIPSPSLVSSNSNTQGDIHHHSLHFSREPPAGVIQSFSGENVPPSGLPIPSSEGHTYMSRYGLQNPLADSISTLGEPGKINLRYAADFSDGGQVSGISDFRRSRISSHYNPYASTFDQPLSTKFGSGIYSQDTGTSYINKYGASDGQSDIPDDTKGVGGISSKNVNTSPTSMRIFAHDQPRSGGDQYDPLFDSIEPSSKSSKKRDHGNQIEGTAKPDVLRPSGSNKLLDVSTSVENDEFGETADAEVGAVENDSPSSPINVPDVATGEIEINQVKNPGKTKKSKDSRSMKLFKVALADFVKEVLKPSWRQGNMSKEAFKTIVKKTVDKVSGATKKHQLPKSQAKINQYIDSSQRKLTKLVMGYVDKYVKV